VSRVFIEGLGLSPKLVGSILTTITEIVHFSGGSILEPTRTNHDQKDFEDNLVLDLVRQTESLVLVTSDAELLRQSPWNGRLILDPKHFVSQVIRSRSL
jgi:predicted nucleic acid-binding protein